MRWRVVISMLIVLSFMLMAGKLQAESVTVYPVQSGLIDDASCCSPYVYSNSSSLTYMLTGCFSDPHYGCWNDRERGAWRWDLENALPETAVATSAHIHWNHPGLCDAWSVYLWIDAGTQVLSSSYCQQIRSNPDQQYSDQAYYASTFSWSLDEAVMDEALNGGYLSLVNQIGSSGQGCLMHSSGDLGVRIIIEYELDTCEGDFDGDNAVDVDDLLALIGAFGTTSSEYDLDGDAVITVDDVLVMLSVYGECP
ncbi:MAG: hypothetical protein MK116_04455 [Phycisphaerales bacterium]|nr:hypothetical protein [Phycisphaerales bacterium]